MASVPRKSRQTSLQALFVSRRANDSEASNKGKDNFTEHNSRISIDVLIVQNILKSLIIHVLKIEELFG